MSRRMIAVLLAAAAAVLGLVVLPAAPAGAVAGRNLPAGGRVLALLGQSAPDLGAYRQQVLDPDPAFPRPGGVTLYTTITPGVCTGLDGPCSLRGNVNDLPRTLADYPGAALAVGLYLSDAPSCANQPLRALIGRNDADIAGGLGGQYRANLDRLVTRLRDTGRTVYLRVGYEFDGPWNCYNTDFYRQAFRYVKGRVDALGATRVATVWQSATYPQDGAAQYGYDFSAPGHLDAWYPGDDVVDWTGLSTFSWDRTYRQYQWQCTTPTTNPRTLYDRMLGFSRNHDKPAMIAEAAPQAYRTRQLDASCTTRNQRVALPSVQALGAWYDEYFGYVAANADVLRAAAYINADWEAIEQFACPPGASAGQATCTDGYWGNSRIQDDAWIRANAKREWQNSLYVNGTLAGRGADWGSGAPPTSGPTTPPPTSTPVPAGRQLLVGQSTKAAWDDYTSVARPPAGGSVYYELRSGDFVSAAHRQYAEFLAGQGRTVQVGLSWKDNPPGFTGGDENAKAARSRAVTAELAAGQYAGQLARLTDFVRRYRTAHYLVRLDYEVSSFYHCATADCASYKGAFARLRSTIAAATPGVDVKFVFHPVRGEYAALYPGDAVTDWVGVSVFAHELCLPFFDNGYRYNGTPPQNYDTGARQCRAPYIGRDQYNNPAAVWRNWDYDANVLGMMKFSKDHGKPMVVAEAGLMNFTDGGGDTSGLEPASAQEWVRRFFGLMAYSGPLPNVEGTYDLSGVIRAATYIDLDFRYGWDGVADGTFDFPVNSTWFVDGRLSRYPAARQEFCAGLAARGFSSGC